MYIENDVLDNLSKQVDEKLQLALSLDLKSEEDVKWLIKQAENYDTSLYNL